MDLSTVNTIGTQLAVLYREVSLIQRSICTQLYVVGTADTALIREVSLIQSALYREVQLYVFDSFLNSRHTNSKEDLDKDLRVETSF